jgi:hypothetical protein
MGILISNVGRRHYSTTTKKGVNKSPGDSPQHSVHPPPPEGGGGGALRPGEISHTRRLYPPWGKSPGVSPQRSALQNKKKGRAFFTSSPPSRSPPGRGRAGRGRAFPSAPPLDSLRTSRVYSSIGRATALQAVGYWFKSNCTYFSLGSKTFCRSVKIC